MTQPHQLQVSQSRVQDILRGKAGAAISDLMVENAQLTAALEASQVRLQEAEQQLREMKRASSNGIVEDSLPASPPPQDTSV